VVLILTKNPSWPVSLGVTGRLYLVEYSSIIILQNPQFVFNLLNHLIYMIRAGVSRLICQILVKIVLHMILAILGLFWYSLKRNLSRKKYEYKEKLRIEPGYLLILFF